MPYQPHALDQHTRERSFRNMFIGLAANCILLFDVFVALPDLVRAVALGGVVGGLLVAGVMASQVDDYFRALCNVGQRWAIVGVGAYLVLYLGNAVFHTGYGAGVVLGGGDAAPEREPVIALSPLLSDGYFVALCFAMLFYLGYAYAALRDRL